MPTLKDDEPDIAVLKQAKVEMAKLKLNAPAFLFLHNGKPDFGNRGCKNRVLSERCRYDKPPRAAGSLENGCSHGFVQGYDECVLCCVSYGSRVPVTSRVNLDVAQDGVSQRMLLQRDPIDARTQ
jgi:hypothetical protein